MMPSPEKGCNYLKINGKNFGTVENISQIGTHFTGMGNPDALFA